MAPKQAAAGHNSTDVWEQIDSTNINVLGKRVFFHDRELGKCLAFVTGTTGRRTPEVRDVNENVISGGQRIDILTVFSNRSGISFGTQAILSDDRRPDTYALANDGDLTDATADAPLHETLTEVVEASPDTGSTGGNASVAIAPAGTTAPLDPADTDGDGVVSNKERKTALGRKGRG